MDEIEVHATDEHGRHITRTVVTDPAAIHMLIPAAELGALHAEVARLRAGESEHPAAVGVPRTPAEWIHQWNRATAEQRLNRVEQILADAGTASRCQQQDHDTVLQELANALQAIGRVRELHQPVDVEFARGPNREQGETEDVRYLRKCCSHCADDHYGQPVDWPCDTTRALDGGQT